MKTICRHRRSTFIGVVNLSIPACKLRNWLWAALISSLRPSMQYALGAVASSSHERYRNPRHEDVIDGSVVNVLGRWPVEYV